MILNALKLCNRKAIDENTLKMYHTELYVVQLEILQKNCLFEFKFYL